MDRLWLIIYRWRWLAWLMLLLPALAILWLGARLPVAKPLPPEEAVRVVELPRVERIPDILWTPMVPPKKTVKKASRDVHDFYRFVGPIKYENRGVVQAKAIVDDLKNDRQGIFEIDDVVNNELKVLDVQDDLMVVEFDGIQMHLGKRFDTTRVASTTPAAAEEDTESIPFWDRPGIKHTRYGKMIAENRWVLQRDKIMEYYEEMTLDPSAMVRLFDSFRPDRDEKRKVQGYRLKFQGQQDFLSDMGLQEGDTVRKVNSMPMTSQRRAEWFIAEFVRGNVQAFVLDVEREGEMMQQVFIVR